MEERQRDKHRECASTRTNIVTVRTLYSKASCASKECAFKVIYIYIRVYIYVNGAKIEVLKK